MLAAELAEHGIASIISPVMRIELLGLGSVATPPTAMLVTSRHALHALAELPADWRSLPLYCVGDATAEAARMVGFPHVIAGGGEVLSLLPQVALAVGPGSRVLYLSGEETRADVATLLASAAITVDTQVVYRAIAETALDATVLEALKAHTLRAAAFFSPRSAALACGLLKAHKVADAAAQMEAFCLSLNVAGEAGALPWAKLYAAHQPTRTAMVQLIVSQMGKA